MKQTTSQLSDYLNHFRSLYGNVPCRLLLYHHRAYLTGLPGGVQVDESDAVMLRVVPRVEAVTGQVNRCKINVC